MGNTIISSFVFSKSCVKQTKENHRHHRRHRCRNNCCHNKKHNYTFKLTKCDFLSSALAISTSKEDAWNGFLENIDKYVSSQFVISLRCCKAMHALASCLLGVTISEDRTWVKLYFKCNVIPSLDQQCPRKCIPITTPVPIINNQGNHGHVFLPINDYQYQLQNGMYYDCKFYCDGEYENAMCFVQQESVI
jgi:hypothetical protein